MPAVTNTNTTANIAAGGVKARELDFVTRFNKHWEDLVRIMGIMRPVRKAPGTTLTSRKAKVTLAESVGEGEIINLSAVEYETVAHADLKIRKYKTSTTVEAVDKYGADVAVEMSDDAFLDELQAVVMGEFYGFVQTGALTRNEVDFQMAVAMAIGSVKNKFKQMHRNVTDVVTFVNTLDAYEYLGAANITVQSKFGLDYVENFLGARVMFITSDIPQGKVIATPKENIVLYYMDPRDSAYEKLDLHYTTVAGDETTPKLIGFHAEGDYNRAVGDAFAIMGMKLWCEYLDGVAVVTIDNAPYDGPTVAAATQESYWGHTVDSLQSDVTVTGDSITGTLHYVNSGALATDWGPGNFIALKFTPSGSDTTATKYRVGLNPSEGSGMQELDSDMDGVFKVTDPNRQWLMVETSNADGTHVTTKAYKLSGLVCEKA